MFPDKLKIPDSHPITDRFMALGCFSKSAAHSEYRIWILEIAIFLIHHDESKRQARLYLNSITTDRKRNSSQLSDIPENGERIVQHALKQTIAHPKRRESSTLTANGSYKPEDHFRHSV